MLSVKKAKEHCGYQAKPVHQTCSNCAAFASERILPKWMEGEINYRVNGPYTVEANGIEKNLRCADHGFAVKKTSTCRLWKAQVEKSE
jgi:hypothetical protein